MPYEVTNPGPWEYWPTSGHVIDAEGNTVCTIAPDCSEQAKAIIAKAPEAVKMLGELLTSITRAIIEETQPGEIEISDLLDEIKLTADFMQQFKPAKA